MQPRSIYARHHQSLGHLRRPGRCALDNQLLPTMGSLLSNPTHSPSLPNTPVVTLASSFPPVGPFTANQMWNMSRTNNEMAPWSIGNQTTGMWLGYSQPVLQAFTQAVMETTEEGLNLEPIPTLPVNSNAFW
ncbi:hypothetical protein B0H13DRAFT_1892149 [Mycena leptocephala]|nr:hypothetical protein B0H13DRAFT_1892149 [Mycena leptocephala]